MTPKKRFYLLHCQCFKGAMFFRQWLARLRLTALNLPIKHCPLKTLAMKFCFFLLSMSFISTNVFAGFYCTATNHLVNEGDLMETVRSACGEPTRVVIKNEVVDTPMMVTQWVYMTNGPLDPTKTSDYLARLIVIFDDQNKVITLRQSQIQDPEGYPNEPDVVSCNVGSVIKVGDDMTTVQFSCGKPTFINKLQSEQAITSEIIEWWYQAGSNIVPVVFRFEKGVLKEIKR